MRAAASNEVRRPKTEDAVVDLADKNVLPAQAPPPEQVPAQAKQPPNRAADYGARLRAAPDYLDYVRSLIGAAHAGDRAAQFYVFRAFDYCAVEYRAHLYRRGVRGTLDDALKRAATRWPYDSETVRLVYTRCQRLMESDEFNLDKRGGWLKMASDAGYPLAQAVASHTRFGKSFDTTSGEVAASENGRRLLSQAIRSGDPEVLWEIGAYGLAPDRSDDVENADLDWFLAACQRGLECAPQSDRVRMLCMFDTNCQPYESVVDVIRRANENDFQQHEARARWINEKIDAGDWAALGF